MGESLMSTLPLLAQYGPRGDWWGPGMMGGWGMGWIGMFMGVAFWALIIVGGIFLIRWLIRASSSQQASPGQGDNALEILRRRYARGEINKDQFEAMKRDLSA
jgi:putative membrane protein